MNNMEIVLFEYKFREIDFFTYKSNHCICELIVRGRSPRTDYSRNEWDQNVCKWGKNRANLI